MNCDEAKPLLDPYHDRELDPDAAAGVAAHLAGCPACSATVQERRALGDYLRRHGRSPLPADLWTAIEARTVPAPAPGGLAGWWLPRLAAAALGAVLVGGPYLAGRGIPGSTTPSLPEPIRTYLGADQRLDATPVGQAVELELRRRPEQRVLDWARTRTEKR